MCSQLSENGFKLSLWQHPYLIKGTEVYKEAAEKGYLAKPLKEQSNSKDDNKHTLPVEMEKNLEKKNSQDYGELGIIDLSNPEAVKWYQNLLKHLLEIGVSVIKADFGEAADENAKYMNISGEAMHNLYPLLYNKAVFEVTEEVKGKGNGVIWTRSAYAGSQRYPLHWSGDITANFSHMQTVLRSGLQFGLSGFVFWSHDIGGFLYEPSPELYIRWSQFGLFCSHSRCHGVTPREPWHYGDEALRIFKKYDELRYALMPYIYTQAQICAAESIPMIRALVIDYQDDKNVYNIDDEYMFGDSILIAPIISECNERNIYIPEGIWYDYWNGVCYQGKQWINYKAPLDIMPMFIKKGSIIPMQDVQQNITDGLPDKITLAIWPDEKMHGEIKDKNIEIAIDGFCESGELTVHVKDNKHEFEIKAYGEQPRKIRLQRI